MSNVFPAGEVVVEGRNTVDRTPGDSPPSKEEREDGKPNTFPDSAIVNLDEVDIRWTFERHDEDRNAVLEDDKFTATLEFKVDLIDGHVFKANDFGLDWVPM